MISVCLACLASLPTRPRPGLLAALFWPATNICTVWLQKPRIYVPWNADPPLAWVDWRGLLPLASYSAASPRWREPTTTTSELPRPELMNLHRELARRRHLGYLIRLRQHACMHSTVALKAGTSQGQRKPNVRGHMQVFNERQSAACMQGGFREMLAHGSALGCCSRDERPVVRARYFRLFGIPNIEGWGDQFDYINNIYVNVGIRNLYMCWLYAIMKKIVLCSAMHVCT